ncbi:MAG: glutathione synthase [Deltaproteobacteria bacterium]|nr:glutathione synthase [Deltaproteobacteria bacterium]
MKLLFILNPYEGYDLKKDTTHLLMLEAYRRGYTVYYGEVSKLFMEKGEPTALVRQVKVLPDSPFFEFHGEKQFSLKEFNQIWMRQDPPWNMAYYYATLILSAAPKKVKIVNAPEALRDWNEKMSIFFFNPWIAPTIVSSQLPHLISFWRSQKEGVIIKPMDSFGGRGIQRLKPFREIASTEAEAILLRATQNLSTPVMAQKFLEAVNDGEKRVFLWNGKILGALKKVPPAGQFITSPDLGGTLERTTLTLSEKKLSQQIAKKLLKEGVYFTGIDLIGGYLTEINVTSPGLLWELNELYGEQFEKKIWDDL